MVRNNKVHLLRQLTLVAHSIPISAALHTLDCLPHIYLTTPVSFMDANVPHTDNPIDAVLHGVRHTNSYNTGN